MNFRMDELRHENLFLSSSCRQSIIEEISDVYLGWIYDKEIKGRLL